MNHELKRGDNENNNGKRLIIKAWNNKTHAKKPQKAWENNKALKKQSLMWNNEKAS